MSAADTVIVTAAVDAALKAKLDALARKTNRTESGLAAEAIALYVEISESHFREIEAGLRELDEGNVFAQEQAEEEYQRLLQRR